jgi:hypothetical protein
MFTFPWHTAFNVHTEFLVQAPVWIELQFRDLIFEPQRRKLVEQLGPILNYTIGEEWSTYPHDRVCVMWDMRRVVPQHIKIVQSSITFWQPIEFKTLPQMCFICRADNHLAHNCPRCPIKVDPLLDDPIQRSVQNNRRDQSEDQTPVNKNSGSSYNKDLVNTQVVDSNKSRNKETESQETSDMAIDAQRKRELEAPSPRENKRFKGSVGRSPRKYDPMDLS